MADFNIPNNPKTGTVPFNELFISPFVSEYNLIPAQARSYINTFGGNIIKKGLFQLGQIKRGQAKDNSKVESELQDDSENKFNNKPTSNMLNKNILVDLEFDDFTLSNTKFDLNTKIAYINLSVVSHMGVIDTLKGTYIKNKYIPYLFDLTIEGVMTFSEWDKFVNNYLDKQVIHTINGYIIQTHILINNYTFSINQNNQISYTLSCYTIENQNADTGNCILNDIFIDVLRSESEYRISDLVSCQINDSVDDYTKTCTIIMYDKVRFKEYDYKSLPNELTDMGDDTVNYLSNILNINDQIAVWTNSIYEFIETDNSITIKNNNPKLSFFGYISKLRVLTDNQIEVTCEDISYLMKKYTPSEKNYTIKEPLHVQQEFAKILNRPKVTKEKDKNFIKDYLSVINYPFINKDKAKFNIVTNSIVSEDVILQYQQLNQTIIQFVDFLKKESLIYFKVQYFFEDVIKSTTFNKFDEIELDYNNLIYNILLTPLVYKKDKGYVYDLEENIFEHSLEENDNNSLYKVVKMTSMDLNKKEKLVSFYPDTTNFTELVEDKKGNFKKQLKPTVDAETFHISFVESQKKLDELAKQRYDKLFGADLTGGIEVNNIQNIECTDLIYLNNSRRNTQKYNIPTQYLDKGYYIKKVTKVFEKTGFKQTLEVDNLTVKLTESQLIYI